MDGVVRSQCEDLRSGVVKEVCRLLSFLAGQLKDGFDDSCDFFIPHLLKRTGERTEIVAASAHNCIRAMIEVSPRLGASWDSDELDPQHCHLSKAVTHLIGAANQPNEWIRMRAMEYLLLLLEIRDLSQLEKFASACTYADCALIRTVLLASASGSMHRRQAG
jgi:hypothetical protein